MRVFNIFLAASSVLAQEETTTVALDDFQRGRNKKKQQAAAEAAQYGYATEAPVTTVPIPTTTPLFETVQPTPKPTKNPYGGGATTKKPKTKTTTTTKKNKTKYTTTTKKNKTKTTTRPSTSNPYGGGGNSGAYGDPHFHIVGISATQPDLCFDYTGQPGAKITLLEDKTTGISAVGELFKPDEEEKGIYFKSITLTSAHSTVLTVSGEGWTVDAAYDIEPQYDWETETLKYGDMRFGSFQKHGGAKGSKRMDITIPGVGTYQIQVSDAHKNVNFKVLDTSSVSAGATGILGRFLPVGAYEVRPDLSDVSTGFLVFNGKMTEVNYKRHAWNKNCWTLSEADFLEMVDMA